MIYEKSARGYGEFSSSKRSLSVRERQVLLLVNGIRTLDDLEKFFKKDHLIETLLKLKNGGFIQCAEQSLSSQSPLFAENLTSANIASANIDKVLQAAPTTASLLETGLNQPLSSDSLEAVKMILIEACEDYLGLMGRAIKTRIGACDNETELRNCISNWHMAMRESKLGRESSSFLMQQIHQVLAHGAPKTDWPVVTIPNAMMGLAAL